MKRFRHTLGSLFGALLCLMALASTAAPIPAHTVSHWLSPVSAGEHHHHHDDGSVTVGHQDQQNEHSDDRGHEHMATAVAIVMVPPVEAAFAGAPFTRGESVVATGAAAPAGLHPPPDDRPPRTI